MDQEKIVVFEAFAKKAAQKIEERKKKRTKTLYIGDLNEQIEIRGLTEEEFKDCSEYSKDGSEADKYTMYYASKTLQELAGYMVEQGMIKEHLDVCNMIAIFDRNAIIHEILELSGLTGKSSVKPIEELEEVKK